MSRLVFSFVSDEKGLVRQIRVFALCLFLSFSYAQGGDARVRVKDGVYKDGDGNIFLKVSNPCQYNGPNESEYLFLEKVYQQPEFKMVPLNKIVDLDSISRKNRSGTYFLDKNYVYMHIFGHLPPGYRRFTAVENRKAKLFGKANNYLRTGKSYYYRGVLIQDLDAETATYLVWEAPEYNKKIELMRDKTGYYYGKDKLNMDLLCRTGYSDSLKAKIMHDLLGDKSWKVEDCKQFE